MADTIVYRIIIPLGHEDVSIFGDDEFVSLPEFFEDVEELVFSVRIVEVWPTVIATTGDEVELVAAVIPLEAGGHGGRVARL